MTGSVRFKLPPKGSLTPTGSSDPLNYYYLPLVGKLYTSRISMTLRLLGNTHFENTLEIGYGSGVLIPTLCKISQQVYGVDLDSDADLVAHHLSQFGCQVKLSRGVPDKLLFQDNQFDLIVAISVLEHIQEIHKFLTEIHRVLKPGGTLLVGMPAVNKFMGYLFSAIGFSGIDHHHVTTPEEMNASADTLFQLKSCKWMPSFLPSNFYLYKSFCFEK